MERSVNPLTFALPDETDTVAAYNDQHAENHKAETVKTNDRRPRIAVC